MSNAPQKWIFKDLRHCHTKRRIGGQGATDPTYKREIGGALIANPFFGMILTKILIDIFFCGTHLISRTLLCDL